VRGCFARARGVVDNPAHMRLLGKLFFRGLAAILPLALTGYLVSAAVVAGETLLHRIVVYFIPEENYHVGMGFLLSIVFVLAVGLLMYSFLVRAIYARATRVLTRIPVIKSIYGMIVDIVQLFGGEQRPFHKVVLVRVDQGGEMLGFVSREDFADMPAFGEDRVAVYLPMSYQLGGFTLIVDRARVREVPMQVEDALRFCVTAGVAKPVG